MPSRERVITTITEGDSENEEPIISEVIEILDDGDSGEHDEPTPLLSRTLTEDVSSQEVEILPNTPSLKENNSGVKSKVVTSKSIGTTNKETAPSPTVSTLPSTSNSKTDKKSGQRTLGFFFRKPAKSSSSASLPKKSKKQNPASVTNHAVSSSVEKDKILVKPKLDPVLKTPTALNPKSKSTETKNAAQQNSVPPSITPQPKPTPRTNLKATVPKKGKPTPKRSKPAYSKTKPLVDADIMAIVLGNSSPTDTNDIVSQTPTHDSQTTVCGVEISALLPELVTRDRHESGKKRTKAKKSPSRDNKAKKACAVEQESTVSTKTGEKDEKLVLETTLVSDKVANNIIPVANNISSNNCEDLAVDGNTKQVLDQECVIPVESSILLNDDKTAAIVEELSISKQIEMEYSKEKKAGGIHSQEHIPITSDEVQIDEGNKNKVCDIVMDVDEDENNVNSSKVIDPQTGDESEIEVAPTRKTSVEGEAREPVTPLLNRTVVPKKTSTELTTAIEGDVDKREVPVEGQTTSDIEKDLIVTDLKPEILIEVSVENESSGRDIATDADSDSIKGSIEDQLHSCQEDVISIKESLTNENSEPVIHDLTPSEELPEAKLESSEQEEGCSQISTTSSTVKGPDSILPANPKDNKDCSTVSDSSSSNTTKVAELRTCQEPESSLQIVALTNPAKEMDCDKAAPSCEYTATTLPETQQTKVCDENENHTSTAKPSPLDKLGKKRKRNPKIQGPSSKGRKSIIAKNDKVVKLGKKKKTNPEVKVPVRQLSEAERSIITQHENMGNLYTKKVAELVERATNGEFVEEEFQRDVPKNGYTDMNLNLITNVCTDEEFRDEWLPGLALLVQGSPLPLNSLAHIAHKKIISEAPDSTDVISINAVISKIKLIASRTQYLLPVPSTSSLTDKVQVDIYSNTDVSMMWRWELSSLDLLDIKYRAMVKKARNARKKTLYHQKSILRLLSALKYSDKQIKSSSKENWESQMAKIHAEEEKVLKYEREEEKARLILGAKAQKEKEKEQKEKEKAQKEKERTQKQIERQKEKDRAEDEKRREKATKEEEKQIKLQVKLKEAANQKKKKDLEAAEGKEQANRQKARMMSFFKSPSVSHQKKCAASGASLKMSIKKVDKTNELRPTIKSNILSDAPVMDSDQFWTLISSDTPPPDTTPFLTLSSKARSSRKKKTQKLNVTVFVNVVSENPFEQQPYDEERTVLIRNKYKYLSFHEDNRPPYYGTWSKETSRLVTGRKPFEKDTTYFDYDIDSEAEWEEGDDEQGENCSMNDNDDDEIDDEEGDSRKYNFQDGWLAQDDDLGPQDENDDEETMVMRRKQIEECNGSANMTRGTKFSPASVVAPIIGGLPHTGAGDTLHYIVSDTSLIEGISKDDACTLLLAHDVISLQPLIELCLDAYPPVVEPDESKIDCSVGSRKKSTKMASQELTDEELKIFVKFVHKCTLKSKDIVVESLRSTHKNLTSSRAQATRKLDLIATKRRLKNGGGVVWEVKNDVLISLGLQDLVITKEERIQEEVLVKPPKNVKKTPNMKVRKKKKENKISPLETCNIPPVVVSPLKATPIDDKLAVMISGNKRKTPPVSAASANLLAAFLNRKKA